MRKKTFFLGLFMVVLGLLPSFLAAQKAKYWYDLLNVIRREKFDLVLPHALRDNQVDMWIHVIKRGDPDPLELDLGGSMGYFVFTDRGGERVERAVFGVRFAEFADWSIYDYVGEEGELGKYVAERDPKKIAVNYSQWLTVADGLSYTGYQKLVKLLGPKYAQRLVSAEKVITDFRTRRVQTEIIAFAHACEIQREIMEEGLRKIKPGVTTLEEIGWWAQDQLLKHGLPISYLGCEGPGVIWSAGSSPEELDRPDYIIQRGDMLLWDWGIKYLNFGTDYKRYAYVLREGETSVPPGIQKAWETVMKARQIIKRTIKVGLTAGEALQAMVRALEKEGFIYTPFTDIGPKDREIVNSLGDSEKPGISIDCHCVGNTGNSEVAVGPSIAPFRPDRAHLRLNPNNLFAFEFIVHVWVPEWKRRFRLNLEDNAILTEQGVEFLYPPNEKIILVK